MRRILYTADAPAAIGPYVQANRVGDFVFTSGQIPVDPATGLVPASIEEQTAQSLRNIAAILNAAGAGLDKVIKTTVFLRDMNDFAAMNGVYADFFPAECLPARSAVQVARLPKDVGIEIEAVAYLG